MPQFFSPPVAAGRWHGPLITLATLAVALPVFAAIWLPGLPAEGAHIGGDYAFFLPNLLAGTFWRLSNPIAVLPWFSPGQCGGFALHADPQGLYLSLTQVLAWMIGPMPAVRAAFLIYAACGFVGAVWLARDAFGLRWAACLLAGILILFNGFFAVRMMVGHLAFAGFMLLPALAACLLACPARRWTGEVAGVAGCALLLAVMIHSGMAALLLPCLLSVAMLLVMQALATGAAPGPALLRFGAGVMIGLALCAGRLAVMAALLANLPRPYPLPGYEGLGQVAWVALRAVFLAPWPDMAANLLHTPVRLYLHEFDYGVGPMALLLMLAWAAGSVRGVTWPTWRAALLWAMLAFLLLVPLVLNISTPGWSAFLKSLPVLGSSSLLLRWLAAYILPAAVGAAIALDRLAARGASAWLLGGLSALGTVAALLLTLGGGRPVPGGYDAAPIQAAWRLAVATGRAPPVTALVETPPAPYAGYLAGQNALAGGASQIDCYQPLFGYALESFPRGTLHPGPILDVREGRLNLKNPACYVFPGANACRPGDAFTLDQTVSATALAAWHPFAWRRPLWARAADGIGTASAALLLAACMAAAWRTLRRA